MTLMKLLSMAVIALTVLNAQAKTPESRRHANAWDKVVGTQWCRANVMHGRLVVVDHYSFTKETKNLAKIGLIVVPEDKPALFYDGVGPFDWFLRGKERSRANSLSVELIADPIEVGHFRKSLEYHNQQSLADAAMRTNTELNRKGKFFAPEVVLRIKDIRANAEIQREYSLYPCSEFSTKFTESAIRRPSLEYNLVLAQTQWQDFSDQGLFQTSMSLNFPLEHLKPTDLAKEGSSWCSWTRFDDSGFDVSVVTFRNGKLAHNQIVSRALSDARINSIGKMAAFTSIFSVSANQKRLHATSLQGMRGLNAKVPYELEFAAMRDASGIDVLVLVDAQGGPSSYYSQDFSNLYFPCSDPRPLRLSSSARNLPRLIEVQREMLRDK